MKKNHKKKAIIVARTATKNPKSGLTLNSQFSWAKQKAKELDAVIVNTFSFNGMSANSFFEEYAEQILSTICQQKIDYLIVYQFNRLTRDLSKGLNIFRKTIKLGCAIVTSSETFDETSDIFKHIEQAIAFDEGILKLPCKRCDSFMMKKNGREVNEGFVVQRFNCKECDYRFHVPSHKQLNHEGYHE